MQTYKLWGCVLGSSKQDEVALSPWPYWSRVLHFKMNWRTKDISNWLFKSPLGMSMMKIMLIRTYNELWQLVTSEWLIQLHPLEVFKLNLKDINQPNLNNLVLILGFSGFISAANSWFVSPVLPAISNSFGTSIAQAGIILTAYMIPYGIMQPLHLRYHPKAQVCLQDW